jgi:hypothetical protein
MINNVSAPLRAKTGEFMSVSAQDVALDALCEQLQKIRQQAEIAGLFIGDRELLDCTHCGLQEDVLINGRLVTHQADVAGTTDSGLRFSAADDGNFVCPQCGAVIAGDVIA